MDVKLFLCFICLIFITTIETTDVESPSTSASFTEVLIKNNKPDKKCIRTLSSCTVVINGGLKIETGPKGEMGNSGRDGLPGRDGQKGVEGSPGTPGRDGRDGAEGPVGLPGPFGMPGLKGNKGERGSLGPFGMPGLKGNKGERGSLGPFGMPGLKGNKGERGPEGPPGPVGPPGLAGMPAIYPCNLPRNIYYSNEDAPEDFALKNSPATVPCKSAPEGFNSGVGFMGPESQEFEVYCNMTTRETCIRRDIKTREINYNDGNGTYWLSGMRVNLKDLYNLTTEQVTWLQQHSVSARQTIKYHCLNSVPFTKYNVAASVKLLTWNEAVVGPYPTDVYPFFYSVPTATDFCEEGNTEWKSSIIELQTTNTFRLPIVDLWIGDNRDGDQRMFLESLELCFG